MNCTDRSAQLHDYVDGELAPAEAQALEAHVARCAACQQTLDSLRALRAATAALPHAIAPSRDLWSGIEAQLGASATSATADGQVLAFPRRRPLQWLLPCGIAASMAFAIVVASQTAAGRNPAWNVASLAGVPRVDRRAIVETGQLRVGEWLETDPQSRAKVEVGAIGQVSVEPNSRLRLVGATATDHRLELARGEMSALIWAPPRLFFVNTPSATAIDLGCAYTLKVDDYGAGELRVTSGYVALEHDGRESIIPAGQRCITRPGAGPGTPFASDAPAPLREALTRFDFDAPARRDAALRDVLAQARPDDYVMLWHLLSRAQPPQRGQVFDVLAKSHPAPAGVTRAGIIANNAAMQRAWADELGLTSFAARTTTR
jgi:anti-sigma factor RsiW